MKSLTFAFCLIFIFSCQKKKNTPTFSEEYIPLAYDTTAIDSFSPGAMSVDVAEQIRKSSLAYQDSVRKAKIRQEEERKKQEEEAKKATEEREKLAAEKKKKEEEQKEKKQESLSVPISDSSKKKEYTPRELRKLRRQNRKKEKEKERANN